MNMHGIMAPATYDTRKPASALHKAGSWLWGRRVILGIVVLPTLLLAAYLYLIASNQYESEAHFIVRSAQSPTAPAAGSGVGAALSLVTGTGDTSQTEAMSVADYLTSHDAVADLRAHDQLVERFQRPGIDLFSRLRATNPTPERLLKYYRSQVSVKFNTETGITVLKVHSFTPEDSYRIISRLLELGERRVNLLNERSYNDSMALARRQLAEAEDNLAAIQGRLTSFRQNRRDIDPQASGQAQITLVSGLTSELAAARAQLNGMGSMIDHASPQYRAVASHVAALEAQVASQKGRLTDGGTAIAADIGGYEGLRIRQEFLAKRYDAAAVSLEHARDQAIRQQQYLVRVVDANHPVKSLFPERGRILATAFIVLLLAYSIGWLVIAGVREHAA